MSEPIPGVPAEDQHCIRRRTGWGYRGGQERWKERVGLARAGRWHKVQMVRLDLLPSVQQVNVGSNTGPE